MILPPVGWFARELWDAHTHKVQLRLPAASTFPGQASDASAPAILHNHHPSEADLHCIYRQ